MSAGLHIQLLGEFAVSYDGARVSAVNSPRLRILLAYLILHRCAPQPRQHLAFLLWPDSAEEQARTNLRNLVHLLRHALPHSDCCLQCEGQSLLWEPHVGYTLDVQDFEAAVQTGALRAAVALYRGDLLPDCYGDWIVPERERLRRLYLAALEQVVQQQEADCNYGAALGYAERLVREEPLSEAYLRTLIRLQTLTGDRATALRTYHTCATALRRELGVEPSQATQQLYRQLLHGTEMTAAHPPAFDRTPQPPRIAPREASVKPPRAYHGQATALDQRLGRHTMSQIPPAAQVLIDFQPRHAFFVGIDSDGCAFDAMELKQKECFIPSMIRGGACSRSPSMRARRRRWVNLYSKWRGPTAGPRWSRCSSCSPSGHEVAAAVKLPEGRAIREFLASGYPPSEAGLKAYIGSGHGDEELWRGWSGRAPSMRRSQRPCATCRRSRWCASLQRLHDRADLMVISTTASDALQREWGEHGLAQYMAVMAGQDMGTKRQHLEYAAQWGKYPEGHILMIGDAPGDRDAAHAAGALFYPINPGAEELSWQRFHDEASERFLDGTYAGAYEAALNAEFEQLLSDTPPWAAGSP